MKSTFNDSIERRLIRLESKLVRGFEELGVDINSLHSWMTLQDEERMVTVTTMGRSMKVLNEVMLERGATGIGEFYSIYFRNECIGQWLLQDKIEHGYYL